MSTVQDAIAIYAPACARAYEGQYPTLEMPGFSVLGFIRDTEKTWGFVSRNESAKLTIVAFRGTNPHSAQEWLEDFTAMPATAPWAPNAGCIHEGFLQVYDGVRDSLRALIPPYKEGDRLVIVGHSLGAALATLAGYDFRQLEPRVVTFAGPRVGTYEFARNFNQSVRQGCVRIVNCGDIVPNVPLEPIFHHVGTEIEIAGGFNPADPAVAHSINTYIKGLGGLQE